MKKLAFPKPTKRTRQPSLHQLKERLKKLVYTYVKLRDGNVCWSCGKTGLSGYNWNAGHFIKAEICNIYYKWDLRNIHSQCSGCNLFRSGNYPAYRKKMVRIYGEDQVKVMEYEYNQPVPINFNEREWLEKQILLFKTMK